MKVAATVWKTFRTQGGFLQQSNKEKPPGDFMIGLTFGGDARLMITRPRQISMVVEDDETVLHSAKSGKASGFSIPAVRMKNGMIVASQRKTLVCWNHQTSNNNMMTSSLESPAIQLGVCGSSRVFGVCQNGRIFLADILQSSTTMKIQYLGDTTTKTNQHEAMSIIYRLAPCRGGTTNKRKRHSTERTGICFLKQCGDAAHVVSYTWNDDDDTTLIQMESQQLVDSMIPANLNGVTFLGALNSHVVCAKYGDAVLSFSRVTGRLASSALILPSTAKSVCIAGSGTIAYLMDDNELVLVDVLRNAVVQREVVVEKGSNDTAQMIVADSRENRIAVISKVSSKITSVASTVLRQHEEEQQSTLATVLESSMALDQPSRPRKRVDNHCAMTDAIQEFELACDNVLSGKKAANKKNYLLESFSSAVDKAQRTKSNGVSKNGKHHENGLNGHVNGSKKEATIPPPIVGPCTTAIVRLLASVPNKNDGRFILRRLIRSGYASARNHLLFPDVFCHTGNHSNKHLKKCDKSCYLPLELMHDVLDHCTDVSERIMVQSLKFLMSRISDEDILDFFRKSKRKCLGTIDVSSEQESSTRLLATVDLFAKILDYSPCNEGILRSVLSSELTNQEISLLLKILLGFRRLYAGKVAGFRLSENFIVWITCILDVAQDKGDDATSLRHETQRWVHSELSSMDEILFMNTLVQQQLHFYKTGAAMDLDGPKEFANATTAGYQIEKVQF